MKISVKINHAQEGFILCKLLQFTPEKIVQYYVNHVSIEKFLNSNSPDIIAATNFFIRYANNAKKRK